MINLPQNIISHNRSNYYGVSEKIDSLPHLFSNAINAFQGLQALARANQQVSPIKGKLWSDTPISNMLVGKAHASSYTPPKQAAPAPAAPKPGGFNYNTQAGPTYSNTTSYAPSTGGQTGGDTGGGDTGGGDDGGQAYINELRNAFGSLRSSIEGQLPGLETTYNQVKGDIEAGLGRAKEVFTERQGDVVRGFGENLKSLLMTDRELADKNRNVYSGLNALDSSQYADSENKRGQQLFDTQSRLTGDKERQLRESEREYQAYEQEGNRFLAQAATEYQSGKQALQAALAQNNLDEAFAIQNAMNEIQTRAQQTQDSINAFKMNLATLQAQGTNVMGNLGKFGAGSLNDIFGGYQNNYAKGALASLNPGQTGMQGSGYISSGNRAQDDPLKRLYGNAMA